jgi:hypothetical protein
MTSRSMSRDDQPVTVQCLCDPHRSSRAPPPGCWYYTAVLNCNNSVPLVAVAALIATRAMLTSTAQSFVTKLPKTMSRSSCLFQASVNTFALRESQWFIEATGNSWPRRRLVGKRLFSLSSGPKASEKMVKNEAIKDTTFLQRFLGPKEMPSRGSVRWYAEMALLCTVFAITGSSTMVLVSFFYCTRLLC